jgi:hypothetical protein
MRTGDIILVHAEGFLPDIIHDFQKLEGKPGWELNHAGICINIGGFEYISEMKLCCVNTAWLDYQQRINSKEITVMIGKPKIPVQYKEQEKMIDFAIRSAGNLKYEKKNLCIEQPVKILSDFLTGHEVWIGAKTEKKAEKRMICGEYVAYHYHLIRDYFNKERGDLFWPKIAPIDIYNSGYFTWSIVQPIKKEAS